MTTENNIIRLTTDNKLFARLFYESLNDRLLKGATAVTIMGRTIEKIKALDGAKIINTYVSHNFDSLYLFFDTEEDKTMFILKYL